MKNTNNVNNVEEKESFGRRMWNWSQALAIVVVGSILITTFIGQAYTVSGQSMDNTLRGLNAEDIEMVGDRVFGSKASVHFGVNNGDIVIMDSRRNYDRTLVDKFMEGSIISRVWSQEGNAENVWVKRVVGVAGDVVEVKGGELYRNGEKVENDQKKELMDRDVEAYEVQEGYVYVMGDNRNNSKDSRMVGAFRVENIVAKVIVRVYPYNRIEKL